MPAAHAEIRRLPVLLHRAREAFSAQFRAVFLLHDLTDPQWRVLLLIQHDPDQDISDLVRSSFLLGPSLSRILRDLAARGLIVRTPDPRDARRAFHSLTREGEALIAEVRPRFDPIYEGMTAQLDEQQVRELNQRLEDLLLILRPEQAD